MNPAKKIFVQATTRNELKNAIFSNLDANTGVNFLEYNEIVTSSAHGVVDKVLIGKICKIGEVEHEETTRELFRHLELQEVDEEMKIKNRNRRLCMKLRNKFAYASQYFSENNFIAAYIFNIELVSPHHGYYPYLVTTQDKSKILAFVCLKESSLMLMEPEWKTLHMLKISELQANIKSCFYGIVDNIDEPKRSDLASAKYKLKFIMTDESRQKVQVTTFSNQLLDYPTIKQWNILRVENATVSSSRDNKLIVSVPNGSDILVFDSAIGSSYIPKHTSKLPILSKSDVLRVVELRKWMAISIPKDISLKDVDDKILIFNLHCQVVGCCEYQTTKTLYLLICDETMPSRFLQRPKFSSEYSANPLIYDRVLYEKNINKLAEIWVEGDVSDYLAIKPTDFLLLRCVHLVKYIVDANQDNIEVPNLRMSIIDSSPSRNFEIIEPSYFHNRSILSQNPFSSPKIAKESNEISQSGIGSSPLLNPTFLSLSTAFGNVKLSTIEEIKSHSAPFKFHLTAELIDFFPPVKPLKQFLNYVCQTCKHIYSENEINNFLTNWTFKDLPQYKCDRCATLRNKENSCIVPKFGMKFLLEDVTGTLEVLLWDKHAIDFFHDVTPDDIIKDTSKMQVITNFSDKVQSLQENTINCCIFSYNTENGKKYQIFGTILI